VQTPIVHQGNQPVFHLYVIRSQKRDALQSWLKEQGIGTGIHYPIPVHLQNTMSSLGYHPGDLPVTEKVVGEILSLPMYAELTSDQIEAVCKAIQSFFVTNP
jgi:dTDP-4-amino-4,6-dideoxygalactose transaminase